MSKNNVNPGQYKVAGRERQGEDIVQKEQKERYTESLDRQPNSPGSSKNGNEESSEKES